LLPDKDFGVLFSWKTRLSKTAGVYECWSLTHKLNLLRRW
jgi:hypothetical protein